MTLKVSKKKQFVLDDGPGLADQHESDVAVLNNGNVVAVWTNEYGNFTLGGDAGDASIKVRIFKPNGKEKVAEFKAHTTETGDQSAPRVLALSDGGFIVAWVHEDSASGDGSGSAIHMQRFDAGGNKFLSELQVNLDDEVNSQSQLDLFQINAAQFGFTFVSQTTGNMDIRMNLLTSVGLSAGFSDEFTVNTSTADNQFSPQSAITENGNLFTVWASSTGSDIRGRVVDSDFDNVKSEFTINFAATTGTQTRPAIIALKNGNFVVAWTSDNDEDGDGSSIIYKIYDENGDAVGGQAVLNNIGAGPQTDVSLTALGDGRFMAVWESNDGGAGALEIKGRIFNADGTAYAAEFLINKSTSFSETDPEIATMKNGQVVVSWTTNDPAADGDDLAVMARIVDVGSVRDGTGGKNKITGDNGRDEINGKGGNDTIKGLGGNDVLKGGGGKDKIFAGKGADTAIGGGGKDQFVFAKKDGKKNKINDFDNGQDKLNLKAMGYNNKNQALAEFTDAGGANNNKVIFNDKGTKIVIKGIDLDQLGASDILI